MLKWESITGSATGSSTGSAARSSTRSVTGSSTRIATGCSAGSLSGSETGNGTGSAIGNTSRIWLHSWKESVLCLDPHLAEKKSCSLTWYPIHIPDVQNGLYSTSKCKMQQPFWRWWGERLTPARPLKTLLAEMTACIAIKRAIFDAPPKKK